MIYKDYEITTWIDWADCSLDGIAELISPKHNRPKTIHPNMIYASADEVVNDLQNQIDKLAE